MIPYLMIFQVPFSSSRVPLEYNYYNGNEWRMNLLLLWWCPVYLCTERGWVRGGGEGPEGDLAATGRTQKSSHAVIMKSIVMEINTFWVSYFDFLCGNIKAFIGRRCRGGPLAPSPKMCGKYMRPPCRLPLLVYLYIRLLVLQSYISLIKQISLAWNERVG